MKKNIWKDKPESHDYPAALDYLELLYKVGDAIKIVKKLEKCGMCKKKAKDIFRASGLDRLPMDNIHVKGNIEKVKNGEKLSPLLLVRGKEKLIVADGYHRLCAVYYLSEDYNIPCKLV